MALVSHKAANVVASDQSAGETPCPGVAVQVSAKTLRSSVEDASTLKPSCRRGSRVCKKPAKVEVVKRDHRNVGPSNFITQHLQMCVCVFVFPFTVAELRVPVIPRL